MYLKFVIDPESTFGQQLEEKMEKTQRGRICKIYGMNCDDGPDGPTLTHWEYTRTLPRQLPEEAVTLVKLHDDNTTGFPLEGTYRNGDTHAVVDTGLGGSAHGSPLMWFMNVSGRTLDDVLKMYNAVRTGAIKPEAHWQDQQQRSGFSRQLSRTELFVLQKRDELLLSWLRIKRFVEHQRSTFAKRFLRMNR